MFGDCLLNILQALLERELRRMHADDDEAVVAVLAIPRCEKRQCAHAVDAGVGPEVDQDHVALGQLEGDRCLVAVEPGVQADDISDGRRGADLFRLQSQPFDLRWIALLLLLRFSLRARLLRGHFLLLGLGLFGLLRLLSVLRIGIGLLLRLVLLVLSLLLIRGLLSRRRLIFILVLGSRSRRRLLFRVVGRYRWLVGLPLSLARCSACGLTLIGIAAAG